MIFSSKATPRWQSAMAGWMVAFVGAVGLGVLAACGGGTTQYDPFVPKRLLVFGDEASTLTGTGRRYGVNGLNDAGVVDCTLQPIWVQQLATLYGFTFAECNPTSDPEPKARMLAFAGAKVADVAAQVEAQVAAGGFRDKDLATVLAGTNDLLELYAQYPSQDPESLRAQARDRGQRLAQVVNRLVDQGVKVVVSDLPDLGFTPFALAQKALGIDIDRAAFLSSLTTAFNEQLGVKVVLDGRFVGLVQSQLRFQAINRSPVSFGLSNVTDGVCNVPLPNCTTSTLLPDAVPGSYLWADETRLAPGGQAQLATLALDRARRNPF